MTDDVLEGLNEQQRKAVTTTEGCVRVIAGAGSGKTRALTSRFAYLVNVLGVAPARLLCVTFTNKAANEMRLRIRKATGERDTGYISTFHGFCVSVLQEEAHVVGYPERFLVLGNGDIDAMLALIYEERGLTLRHMTYAHARELIEIRKNKGEPKYYEALIALPLEGLRRQYLDAKEPFDMIFYGYLYMQKKCFGLDYNDLINFTLYIFRENPDICRKWQKRLSYIMVDEFQDIDEQQYRLLNVLSDYHKNLFIVGDPDQTIYGWRGADVRFLLDFDKAYPSTRTILMMENYRSTPQILNAANALIERNRIRMDKRLIAMLPDGQKPLYFHAKDAAEEAKWIAEEVRALEMEGVALGDIAVLYRAHYLTRPIEEVFLKAQLPYVLYSGAAFFERAEVRDALCYLRLVVYGDDLSFLRVVNRPKRNIGERRIARLKAYAEQNVVSLYRALQLSAEEELFRGTGAKAFLQLIERCQESVSTLSASEMLTKLLDESGYEAALRTEGSGERLDNLAELKQSVYEYETSCGEETSLESYLLHVALFTDADVGSQRDAVKLMTVHSAKGLEFPVVFLCELEESVFPSKKVSTPAELEEERRLCFVALTRAQTRLYLSDAEGRSFSGDFRYPSRFLTDIGRDALDCVREPKDELIRDAQRYIKSSERALASKAKPRFTANARVLHPVFGSGTVLHSEEATGLVTVQFDELKTERELSADAPLTEI